MEITEIPKKLVSDITDGNIVLILGSHLSVDAGLPSYEALSKIIISTFGIDHVDSFDFEQVAQVAEAGNGRQAVEKAVEDSLAKSQERPDDKYRAIARAFKFKCIVSTCMDTLIENAFREIHRPYNLILNDDTSNTYTKKLTNILKLYGSKEVPSSMVLTKRDRESYEKKNPLFVELLNNLLRTFPLIVVGYTEADNVLGRLYTQAVYSVKEPHPMYVIPFVKNQPPLDFLDRKNAHVLEVDPTEFFYEFSKPSFNFGRRFDVTEKVGRGGMGEVYKALDKNLNIMVALKILPEEVSNYEWATHALEREAEAASRLSHENIIRLFDSDIEEGHRYISMEYIDGFTLEQILAERGPLEPEDLARYSIQICEGLDYAHRHKIIHRDIKPSNIMITPQGRIKITDFGIARIVKDSISRVSMMATAGTLAYMSPEQLLGKPVDGRSDIYSLGVLLYELSTGSLPFKSGDITYQHQNIIPDLPTTKRSDIPPELVHIIMKCLEKNPNTRYQTSREIIPEFEAYLKIRKTAPEKFPEAGIVNSDGKHPSMVYIPAGYFKAGDNELAEYLLRSGWDKWRLPQKAIERIEYTDGYWIDIYPVTNSQYKEFIDATGHRVPFLDEERAKGYNWENGTFPSGRANHPVVLVSWDDMCAYAEWAGKRLPTEVEWEKAARGIDGRKYPWGNEEPDNTLCNFSNHEGGTTPVDKYEKGKSPYGCYDMAGNVWCWCKDSHPYDNKFRVMKGGSWDFSAVATRCAFHDYVSRPEQWNHDGFRCVKDE